VAAAALLASFGAGLGLARGEARGDAPVVELYTMGVGEALFERFGHAAICLRWPRSPGLDQCFNYGTADFQTPGPLTWGFLRGRADFWVSVVTPAEMMAYYEALDRTVWRQELRLTGRETAAVVGRLRHDTRPENRHFTYNHFRDNCATRLRDLLDEATGGQLRARTGSPVAGPTYRGEVRRGFAEEDWLLLVSDLVLGRAVDVEPTRWQMMFLPAALRREVRGRFDAEPVAVFERRGRQISADPGWGGRGWLLALALLLAAPIVLAWRADRWPRAAVAPAGVTLGVVGLIPWALAVVSVLPELRWNEALLVFVPLDLGLPLVPERWRAGYARVRVGGLVLVAALLAAGVLRQPLWAALPVALLPLAAAALPRRAREAQSSLGQSSGQLQ
jgi:hypothetical protein